MRKARNFDRAKKTTSRKPRPRAKVEALLQAITKRYVTSDFNGLALSIKKLDASGLLLSLRKLVRAGKIEINFGTQHPNPHIKALPLGTPDEQLDKITKGEHDLICAYPTPAHLNAVIDPDTYSGRPFTLRLALGDPQLHFHPFDLTVLEHYRNDPRYVFVCNDIAGRISVSDRYYRSAEMREVEQVLMENFGFCFDPDLNRAVAAYNRYLHQLTPEHQQIWDARRLSGAYTLHSDYRRVTNGEFNIGVSVFEAFLGELATINTLSLRMHKVPLFRDTFLEGRRPSRFSFLIRPTRYEYNQFVVTLDQLMADNLNRDVFKGHLALEHERTRADGKIEVRQKGTIELLEEWLGIYFHTAAPAHIDSMISTFRKIRQQRQRPAHKLDDDHFDPAFERQQRELVAEAYTAINTLRQVLQRHPRNRAFAIDSWLDNRPIRNY